ncbi:hypothetical protein BH20ACI1_BH20ACI1_03870 [soil metagenome]
MAQINLSYTEAIMYVALIGLVFGFLLGLIPLILGIKKGKRSYGYYGIAASALLGLVSPILSVITVVVFVWLILRKPESTEVVVSDEKPVDVSTENSENS